MTSARHHALPAELARPEPPALPPLPPLRQVIAAHGLAARKALGQNFILDLNLTRRIVRAAGDLAGVHVVEVGPGPGGLTRALLESAAASVTAIERDPRCIAALAPLEAHYGPTRFRLIAGDALGMDLAALVPAPRAVVANLPYNVATELAIGWLHRMDAWASLTTMFQREVAQRLVAQPGDAAYGRLAVIAQAVSRPRLALSLPPAAFTPPPKVHSAVVQFTPRAGRPAPALLKRLEALTAAAFGQRRKMLKSSLRGVFADPEGALAAIGWPATARAEDLPVAAWLALAAVAPAVPPPAPD